MANVVISHRLGIIKNVIPKTLKNALVTFWLSPLWSKKMGTDLSWIGSFMTVVRVYMTKAPQGKVMESAGRS